MSDKPILFSAPMIRALLNGRKHQTRRIVKNIPELAKGFAWVCDNGILGAIEQEPLRYPESGPETAWFCDCPYGQPGDLIYVREHWRTETDFYNDLSPSELSGEETIIYEADGDWSLNKTVGRFRQSMHMPRWASRLTLKITDVRVERVQDISEDDAQAEGIIDAMYDGPIPEPWESGPTYRDIFADLWDSLNDARGYGWDQNPWVWAISFEVIKQNVNEHIKSL